MFALFILYVVVEVAALIAVGSAIGVMWTVLLLIAGSIIGLVLVRSQGKRIMAGLRAAGRGERSPGVAVADGALFAIGSVALFAPGLVSSLLGILLLLPFTRWALRPLVMLAAARWTPTIVTATSRMRPTVIDGEVVTEQAGSPTRTSESNLVLEMDEWEMDGRDFDKPTR